MLSTNPIDSDAKQEAMYMLPKKKVLIIDDEILVAQTVENHLRRGGFSNLQIITDSDKALDAIREFRPDMVLLDILMPEISGLELLEQISSTPEFDNIIVLMLSGAGTDDEKKSYERGALGFIPKPVTADQVVRIVSSTFRIANRFGTR